MDNDIFFLGNNDYLKIKEKNKDEEKIKNFIKNEKNDALIFFNECLNENFKNKDIQKSFYKYINSIVKYKLETKEQNIEIDNDNKLDEEQFYILNKSFINLKKNRQKSIMEVFQQKKTVNLFNNDKNKKIIINQFKKEKDKFEDKQNKIKKETKEKTENKLQNTEKTLDLTNKI